MDATTTVPTTTTPTSTTSTAGTTTTPETASGTGASATAIEPGQRPTFAQAFAADAASQEATATTPQDAATTQPVEATDPQSAIVNPSTDKQGPIPFAAHKTALDNARLKATQDAQAAFDRDYGWAKTVPRESLERFGQIASQMTSDPIGFLNHFVQELQSHPVHAQRLRSEAGRLLAGARGPQAEPMPQPDVQIVDANGTVTGQTYSADQLAKRDAWREKQLLSKVDEQYGALKTEREQQKAEAHAAERTRQVEAKADDVMAEVIDILDGDKAHLASVAQLMAANPAMTAHKAALEVRKTRIAPAQAGKAQAQVLETLKTKAAAQSVNPASAVPASTHRPKSFLDKSLQW